MRTTCSPHQCYDARGDTWNEKTLFNPFPGHSETTPKHFRRCTSCLLMETYITTLITSVTRQATHSCRLWSLQLNYAMLCNRESLPSLVFDQVPTSHAMQVSYILRLTHSTILGDSEARSRNRCCRAKAISIKNYERVCSCIFLCRIIFSFAACLALPCFSTLPHKQHNFHKKAIGNECVICFFLEL